MSETHGPWTRQPSPKRRPPFGLFLWLGLLAAAALAFFVMWRAFPTRFSGGDWADAARLFALLALVSVGLVSARRFRLAHAVRNIALWAVIFAVGVGAYAFRGDLETVGSRLRSALMPDYPVATSARTMTITRGVGEGFYVVGKVDGAPVRFLIDTGSSDIVLSPADAASAGLDPAALKYSRPSETAGGVTFGATLTVRTLEVGQITLRDVPVSINERPMSVSLLGMPFLRRLKRFEVNGDRLTLEGP